MDDILLRAIAKWPDVPDVYGWLALDRRGNWLLKGERIGNAALREFIGRNYAGDARGRWYFQNGPQRVFVRLAYTPLVVHLEGGALLDQCGRSFQPLEAFQDDEGAVLFAGEPGAALLDDRDLECCADRANRYPRIGRGTVAERFGFIPDPKP